MKNQPKSISPPKMPPNAMAGCVFPEDIMVSILTRLPVKSIVRFKSVCTHWLELLSSRNFKILHHGKFSKDPRNRSFILHRVDDYSINTLSVIEIGHNETKPTILEHPFSYIGIDMDFIGCCNGLVCLSILEPRNEIHLWNPALKLSKKVLPLEECKPGEKVSIGFGYDAKGDDFKVVRMVCKHIQIFRMGMQVNGVEVYSSNSDSWIRIKVDFLFGVYGTKSSANVNGNPYWIARLGDDESGPNRVLVCFDVTQMVFKILPLSVLLNQYAYGCFFVAEMMRLYDFNGCVSALIFEIDDVGDVEYLDFWVFDDSEQVWRKIRRLENIELDIGLRNILEGSKNGEIIGLHFDGQVVVFEPESELVKLMCNADWTFENVGLFEYTESLAYTEAMEKVKARKRTSPACLEVLKKMQARKRKVIDG